MHKIYYFLKQQPIIMGEDATGRTFRSRNLPTDERRGFAASRVSRFREIARFVKETVSFFVFELDNFFINERSSAENLEGND